MNTIIMTKCKIIKAWVAAIFMAVPNLGLSAQVNNVLRNYVNLSPGGQSYGFGGKERQKLGRTASYDFLARQYDPVLCRFTTRDPLAEKYCSISPYAYCAGDPVNRVDPDGKTDYFNQFGDLLFRDMFDNGLMRCIDSESFDLLYQLFDGNLISDKAIDALKRLSYNVKDAFEQNILSNASVLKVISYYNDTAIPIIENNGIDGVFNANNEGANHSMQIYFNANNKHTGVFLENSYNIVNALRGHEMYHITSFLENPDLYSHKSKDQREREAYENQIRDPSWSRASANYKYGVTKYSTKK